jgi:hypothetical protein
MRYSPFSGKLEGIIAATSTTATPSYGPKMCAGYKSSNYRRSRKRSKKTVFLIKEIVIYDQGVPTTSSTVLVQIQKMEKTISGQAIQ